MGRKAFRIRSYQCPRKTSNCGILLRNLKGWHGDCYPDKSEFSWILRGQFSGSRELCRVEATRMIARGKEDNSRNLSGYHQLPQSVKRQLQALFCARSDCRHGRNHHDTDSVSAVLVRFHAPILVPLSKVCAKNTGINFAVYITQKE